MIVPECERTDAGIALLQTLAACICHELNHCKTRKGKAMVKGRSITVCLVALLTLILAGASYAGNAQFTLKFQSSYSTSSKTWLCVQGYADKLEELSGGRIKVERYPSAQLVPTKEALSGLRQGTIDLLLSAGAYYPGIVPVADVFFLPQAFKGPSEVYDLYNNDEFGKIFKDAFLKYGVVHVTPISEVAEIFFMREGKALKSLSDLKGALIRGPGGILNKWVAELGASQVQIPTDELYTALQRGTVDGAIYPTYLLVDLKFYEVVKSVLMNPPAIDPIVIDIYMSKKAYDKLPKDLQECVDKAGRYIQQKGLEIFLEADKKTKSLMKEKGIASYSWPEADIKKAKEVSIKLIDEWAKKSPANQKLVNIIKGKM